MLRRIAILAMAGVILLPVSTMAATHAVSVVNFTYIPGTRTVALGDTVEWTNNAGVGHTTTGDAPLSLWHEALSPDETWPRTFRQAGSFPYFCTVHGPSMDGTIRVPVKVSPTSGGLNTIFTIRVATIVAPAGFQYVIQRRKNNGAWSTWKTTTAKSVTFDPRSTGIWSFRSKLRRISDGASSGYSPVRGVDVG